MNKRDLIEKTIASIETNANGERSVHFFGYGYISDDKSVLLEYTGFEVSLEDCLERGFQEVEEEESENYNQYLTDFEGDDGTQLCKCLMTYDNGICPTPIDVESIDMDTPDGCYFLM